MQQDSVQLQSVAISQDMLNDSLNFPSTPIPNNIKVDSGESSWFHTNFEDCMVLYADLDTVAEYFAHHQGWFRRCAEPMKTQSIGDNAYDILIGRFGAFGYQVEARIGLELLPVDEEGIYRIQTVAVPGYVAPGYVVDFKAQMQLVQLSVDQLRQIQKVNLTEIPQKITGAKWHLDLGVGVQFPQFIHSMPQSLIQNTGNSLIHKIVKNVSRRLSYKTQLDFHTTYNIPWQSFG